MTTNAILQIGLYVAALALLTKPVGAYMARVYSGERTFADPVFVPVERLVYRLTGIDQRREMRWTTYLLALLAFSLSGFLLLYLILRLQGGLPLNPADLPAVKPDLAFNTAVSFVTNTNWQSYSGEVTMSHLTQMMGLTVQNFVSAATGMAIAIALVRGLARHSAQAVGNFWFDLTRSVIWILLPLSVVLALLLVSQGVIQNLDGPREVTTLAGGTQQIALGPVASQEAIKMLGTNGGGFFNANSAHPFENPNGITNFLQMLAIFLIPAGLTYTFGKMVGNTRQGWTIFGAMLVLFLAGAIATTAFEARGNELIPDSVAQQTTGEQAGGNMEGKETRFGITASTLFATITTAASCGAVNAMHDSFTPLGGMIPLLNIAIGEVIFGGVGAGLYGFLIFAILAVFISGLMVGRTPEYLGKKIEAFEMKMASLTILVPPLVVLIGTAIAVVGPGLTYAAGDEIKSNLNNPGAHGFTEVLYAFSSAGNNNGSAFAGLTANEPFYNVALGIAMFASRYWLMIPVLAIAGSLARKKLTPPSAGTLPTHQPLFVVMLVSTILLVGALTFLPSLALGPVVEHLQMLAS